jgi:hypothetical protein
MAEGLGVWFFFLLLFFFKFPLFSDGFINVAYMAGYVMEMRNILCSQKSGKSLASRAVGVICRYATDNLDTAGN